MIALIATFLIMTTKIILEQTFTVNIAKQHQVGILFSHKMFLMCLSSGRAFILLHNQLKTSLLLPVQFVSSEPSLQSLSPSHLHIDKMHLPLAQEN